MENNFEQYETLLGSASEVAEACLDMVGGEFLLAWAAELIRDLVAKGYYRSTRLTTQKLCETVGINWQFEEYDELEQVEKRAWLNLFIEALMDCVGSGVE